MEQAGIQLIAQGAAAFDADMKSATAATNRFVDATEHGGGRVSAAGQMMTGALRHIGTIAVDALKEAARATAAFVGDSIGLAGDFEAGMNEFQSVAGRKVDTAGLDEFHDLFLTLGKELPVSTKDVQMAAIEMVKGGIDPAILAAGGLRQNIQFAAAAMGGDLVKAAEISAKIVGGWAGVNATAAEKTAFLTHATDVLAKAANASNTDVEGLALGIFNAQGIARTAGVPFDDLTTTLAALSPRFESSSVAGNSLKNMIARLQPTTDPAAQAMASLGLYTADTGSAFYDAQGNFIGFEKSAQLLQESLKGLTKEQQTALLQQIFGNDAMGAAAGLAELGAKGYQDMAEALVNANGVAESAALKQEGYNVALDNAKGSVEAMRIQLGEHLLPILTDLLNNHIAPGINAFSDWAGAILGADDPMQALIDSIEEIVPGFGLFVSGVQTGIQIMQDIGAGIGDFVGWVSDLIGVLFPAEEGITEASNALAVFGGATEETIKAVSPLKSAIDDLSGIWEKAQLVIGNVMDAYMHIAQAVLPIITRFIDEHGEEIQTFFATTWKTVIEIINLALDTYNAIVPPVLNAIAGFIDAHGSEIGKILKGAWDMITSLITGALDTIKGVFHVALALLHGDWAGAWTGIQEIVDAQVKAISGIVTGFLNLIAGIFDTSLSDIAQTWEDNWNAMVDLVSDIGWWEAGKAVVLGIKQGIDDAWNAFINWLVDKAGEALDAVFKAWGVASPAEEWMPAGMFAVQGIMQGFSDTWPALTSLVGQLSKDLIDQMMDIGRDMQAAIADSFGATASIDRQIAKNLDAFKDVLPRYEQYTTGALKEAQSQAEGFLDPAEGAKFFAMRSKQILEYAKLQKDLSDEQQAAVDAANDQIIDAAKLDELRAELAVASTEKEIEAIMRKIEAAQLAADADLRARHAAEAASERLEAQMLLINRAQTAEISQFDANKSAQQSPMQQMADSINDVLKALADPKLKLTQEQIKIVDMLSGVWAGMQNPVNARQQAYVNPPQMQYPPAGPTTSSSTQNINMPIYTNNTPAALQQSWAIMEASMTT